jgi:hypothetical protein
LGAVGRELDDGTVGEATPASHSDANPTGRAGSQQQPESSPRDTIRDAKCRPPVVIQAAGGAVRVAG